MSCRSCRTQVITLQETHILDCVSVTGCSAQQMHQVLYWSGWLTLAQGSLARQGPGVAGMQTGCGSKEVLGIEGTGNRGYRIGTEEEVCGWKGGEDDNRNRGMWFTTEAMQRD